MNTIKLYFLFEFFNIVNELLSCHFVMSLGVFVPF